MIKDVKLEAVLNQFQPKKLTYNELANKLEITNETLKQWRNESILKRKMKDILKIEEILKIKLSK